MPSHLKSWLAVCLLPLLLALWFALNPAHDATGYLLHGVVMCCACVFLLKYVLFALVSALGCVNELAELLMVKVGLARITLDDTNWDILANTLGAAVVWLGWVVANLAAKKGRRAHDPRH